MWRQYNPIQGQQKLFGAILYVYNDNKKAKYSQEVVPYSNKQSRKISK